MQKNIGVDAALQKIKHYCAYQERNHREVKEKLYCFGLYKNQVEGLLAQLIEENYLNEERFAIAYAGGKFRINKWGKTKIKYELQQKGISAYCIKKGLGTIDETEYEKVAAQLFNAKLKTLSSERNAFKKMNKVQQYLMQKGFEAGIIIKLIKQAGDKLTLWP